MPDEPKLGDTAMRPMTLTQRTSISITLVIAIIGGIVANVSMMFALRNDVALVQKDVTHVVDDTKEIRSGMAKLAEETRSDSTALRVELSTMRGELTELRARVRDLEK